MLGRRFVLRKKSYQYYLNLLVSTLTRKLAVVFFSEKQKNLWQQKQNKKQNKQQNFIDYKYN